MGPSNEFQLETRVDSVRPFFDAGGQKGQGCVYLFGIQFPLVSRLAVFESLVPVGECLQLLPGVSNQSPHWACPQLSCPENEGIATGGLFKAQ